MRTSIHTFKRALALCSTAVLAGATLASTSLGMQAVEKQPAIDNGCYIVPQRRVFCHPRHTEPVVLESVDAKVDIRDQMATVSIDLKLSNPSGRQQEATVLIPVPIGSTIRSFGISGLGQESNARLLPRDEARREYEGIVRRLQDPGLLEFAGYSLIKSSVFPIPAKGSQTVTVVYEHLLNRDGDRVDFVLPRSDSFDSSRVAWTVGMTIRSKDAVSTVYSPSHEISTSSAGPNATKVEFTPKALKEVGPIQVSYLLKDGAMSHSVLAYPDPEIGGGYFLLLAGAPETQNRIPEQQLREVTLVIDRSGSMRGEKIEQARNAAIQVLNGLRAGESFNIIDYSDTINLFNPKPVVKSETTLADGRAYIQSLQAGGGTNMHDALGEAVRSQPTAGMLPMILFLTDGLPTVGNTSEIAIRQNTEKANTHKRRVFTFGVGYDVNAPLLDKIAEFSRGSSINVLPGEDLEVAVTKVFKRLEGPVLAWPALEAIQDGARTTRMVREIMPAVLPDLFEGDQLVVLGQYRGNAPMSLRLTGEAGGKQTTHTFAFDPAQATTSHSFVPRLWAGRRIANLIDEVRQGGAANGVAVSGGDPTSDPRYKELVDEIVHLSIKFGILTEYTAFLATEGADGEDVALQVDGQWAAEACSVELDEKAVRTRAGQGAVSQSMNIKQQAASQTMNKSNRYYDENMNEVEIMNVQQISDQTLFKRGNCWVDSRIVSPKEVNGEAAEQPVADETVEFASDRYFEIARRLADMNRAGVISVTGDIFLELDGKKIMIKAPEPQAAAEGDEQTDNG